MRYYNPTTHQQRWRIRLRQTHNRFDVYLPRHVATKLRSALTRDDTVSTFVERVVVQYLQRAGAEQTLPSDAKPAPEQARCEHYSVLEQSPASGIDHDSDPD